ncbi:MAG: nucleotidyltransferase domain-containing protein [Thermodesulfobacteriota bacterium]
MLKVSSGSVKIFYPSYKLPELVKFLKDRVQLLAEVLLLRRVAIFGSWAKSRETAFSDIDLMVIYVGAHREDGYALLKKTLNLRGLEPHVFSEEEAQPLKPAIDRMTRDALVFF